MIVVGFNGFSQSAPCFGRLYGRLGVDRYRVLGHDAAASIFVDGVLVAAAEEERFTRVKKTSAFPVNAIRYCLREARVSLEDVDQFAFAWDFSASVLKEHIFRISNSQRNEAGKLAERNLFVNLYNKVLSPDAILRDFESNMEWPIPMVRLAFVPHHLAHLMCGFYLSRETEAAFLISDGRGELFSSIMGEINSKGIRMFQESTIDIDNSIALLYSKVTRYLGFVPNNDEYKVMGLSAFSQPLVCNPLLEYLVTLGGNGTFQLGIEHPLRDMQAYERVFDRIFNRSGIIPDKEWEWKQWVARVAQETVEVITAHQLAYLANRSSYTKVLIEGGVALNCVNNSHLLQQSTFRDIHVSFGASDSGVSIGAGYYPFFRQSKSSTFNGSPYLGPSFEREDILGELAAYSSCIEWEEMSERILLDRVVELLMAKYILGWFQGRMEYGPRALGNRSILANPSFADIQDIINLKIKKREPFRPFAPVVLESRANHIFDMRMKSRSPYMTFVFHVRDSYRDRIPGACHIDGTARVQTISHRENPMLATLLEKFEMKSGVPCLINTSFNVAGEPIVCTPRDAIRCFLGTDLDYLVFGCRILAAKRSGKG